MRGRDAFGLRAGGRCRRGEAVKSFPIVTDGDTYGSADAFWLLGITDADVEALACGAVKPQELPAQPVHIGRILRALRAARDGFADARELAASILADLDFCFCEACAQRRRDDPPDDPPDPDGEGPLVPTGGA